MPELKGWIRFGALVGAWVCVFAADTALAEGGEPASRFAGAPCWLGAPSDEGRIGSIGVAYATGMVPERPFVIARQRAAEGVLGYFGATVTPAELEQRISLKADEVELGGTVIRFAKPYVSQGEIFQYAYSGEHAPDEGRCGKELTADPTRCEPEWTCHPARSEAGVVGISYRAVTSARQFAVAQENAFALLGYAYGVRVQGVERYLSAGNSLGALRLRLQDMEVRRADELPPEVRVHVKAVRFWGDTLLLWMVSPDLPPYPSPTDSGWTKSIPREMLPAAVGSAGPTASGLLSDQLELAVERGIAELAKEASLSVSATDVVQKGSEHSLRVLGVETKVDVELGARVIAVHLDKSRRVSVLVVPTR